MKKVLIPETIIIAVIMLGGWLFGARTLFEFSQALLWGGIVVLGFGVISLVGQWGARTDSTYLVARTAADQDEIHRAHQSFSDVRDAFGFLFETLILGVIPLVLGLMLSRFSK